MSLCGEIKQKKIMRDYNNVGDDHVKIDLRGKPGGVLKTKCPVCYATRHNKADRSLRVDLNTGHCHCYHCGWDVYVPDPDDDFHRRREVASRGAARTVPAHFRRPVFDASKTTLSADFERWLVEQRCIPQHVIAELRLTEQEEYMPQTGQKERCLCFNYFEDGKLVNTKFRTLQKHFRMVSGAELIPYHIDALRGTPECIFTEGELDAASFMAIGRRDVVSVPSGANSNLQWMDRFVETHLEDKRLIYIAVDTDEAGLGLRAELLRRLGVERCRVVVYGLGCKDANEHLCKYGAESLRIALEQAEEVPIEGVFTAAGLEEELRALYERGFTPGVETGWENFDALCTFELRRLMIVTGKPGDGKSEWVDELVLRLCLRHHWDIAFFSPENIPIVYHLRKLAEKLTGCRFQPGCGMSEGKYLCVSRYLTEHVCHILPRGECTLDAVLETGRRLVARRGIRILVVDPLNRLEHSIPPGQTETQYLSSVLNRLSAFAVRHQCLVILVAHPRKMNRLPGSGFTPRVEMYDINGSADFFNKADFGIVVERDDAIGVARIHVDKVKFKHLGGKGMASFVYNPVSGRYQPCVVDDDASAPPERRVRNTLFDSGSWLPEQTLLMGETV